MLQYYIHLLNLEWKKFNANTTVRVLCIIFILMAPFVIFSVKDTFKESIPPFPRSSVFYEFPTVWDYQGYVGNWLVPFILGFLLIFMITSEVSNKTMRQNIITGMTKNDFFQGKLLTLLFLALSATALYAISCLIIGMIYTDGWYLELAMDNNSAIIKFFLMSVGYLSFAMLLSFWIRRGTLTILVYFFYILMLEPLVMALHVYYIRNASRNFYPMNVFEDLHPLPLFRLPDFFVKNEWKFSLLLSDSQAIFSSTIYISIFLGISYWLFMRRDV
jgi:ABC-2 type transport system permease protein